PRAVEPHHQGAAPASFRAHGSLGSSPRESPEMGGRSMGMTKSGFRAMALRIGLGTAFAAALAVGCDDYNGNNNPPYTGAGGFVQCITYRTTGGAGMTGVDGGNNDDGGVACNPNGNGNGTNPTTTTTGSGGTTGTGGT